MGKAVLATVIGLLVALALPSAQAAAGFGSLTVGEVAQKLTQKNIFVYDNNAFERYQKGHVPGAKWLNPYTLEAKSLPADKEATLIFYCASEQCSACHDGARAALKLGYSNVFIMPAGIAGWEKAKLPTEKGGEI